ncbi:unnamed protein product [Camellia sinensis]
MFISALISFISAPITLLLSRCSSHRFAPIIAPPIYSQVNSLILSLHRSLPYPLVYFLNVLIVFLDVITFHSRVTFINHHGHHSPPLSCHIRFFVRRYCFFVSREGIDFLFFIFFLKLFKRILKSIGRWSKIVADFSAAIILLIVNNSLLFKFGF